MNHDLAGHPAIDPLDIQGRIDRLPASPVMTLYMVLISLGVFWDTYMLYSIGPLSFHFVASHGQHALATRIPTMLFLGTFIGALALGRMADRIGRGRAFTLNLGLLAFGAVAATLAPLGPVFLLAIFIAGLGTGAEIPLSVTYMQEIAPSNRRGRMSSLMLTFGFCGGTVGGLLTWWLSQAAHLPLPGFRIALAIAALGAIVSVFLRLIVPESPRWLERVGRAAEAQAAMQRIERATRGSVAPAAPVAKAAPLRGTGGAESRGSTLELFRGGYLRRTLSAWIIEFLQGFGSYGFTTFVPIILYARGYTLLHALGYTALIQISYPIGTYLSSFVTDRIPRKWGIAGFYLLNMLAGLGFYFSSASALVVVFGFLTEMLIFMDGPLLHTYEAEIYPTPLRGRGSATAFSVSRLGGFLAPLVAGIVVAHYGTHSAGPYLIVMAAGSWLLCALVAALLAVDTSGASLEELELQAAEALARN